MPHRARSVLALLVLGLAACEPRPDLVYRGPEKVTAEVYEIADSVQANCELAARIIVRDNAIHAEQTRGLDRVDDALWRDILPGGDLYAEATLDMKIDEVMVESLTDAPMREYAISRLRRERGDQLGEVQALVLSILPQESFAEWRANAAGKFRLRNEGSFGVYGPAACRLARLCRLPRSKQSHIASQCLVDW